MLSIAARRWAPVLLLLLLAWLVYRPGLSGGFLFDDFVNLDALGNEDPLAGINAFLRYLTSGAGDPTGRPVAMLSFLLDARSWPADPAPFLRTNLLIHLANGVLLAGVLRRLGAALGPDDVANRHSSLLGAALWLLHPLFVSTTLYVVQREAMLAASFVLSGLLAYLHGRAQLLESGGRRGSAWMVAGVAAGTLLAGLSKANGFLFPSLVLLLEWILLPAGSEPGSLRRLRQVRHWLLWPATLALFAVLASYALSDGSYIGRSFTLGQRLLSENRAISAYLYLLIVPRAHSGGVFNDAFLASTSWLHPATTLPAMLLVASLAATTLALRRRAPMWSAAIGFYLVAHALESSVIPLELYYEHRNYLPALLLFWPLARWLYSLSIRPAARHLIGMALVGLLAFTTWQRACIWGNQQQLAASWLAANTQSSRAIAASAIVLRESGQAARASALLAAAWKRYPDDAQIALNFVESQCAAGQLQPMDLQRLGETLARWRDDPLLVYRWLDDAIGPRPGFACKLPNTRIETLADVVAANPALVASAASIQNLESIRGRLAIASGEPDAAAAHFRASLLASVRPEVAAAQAALLIAAGYDRAAMNHLDLYDRVSSRGVAPAPGMPRVHAWLLRRQGYWEAVFAAERAAARAGESQ